MATEKELRDLLIKQYITSIAGGAIPVEDVARRTAREKTLLYTPPDALSPAVDNSRKTSVSPRRGSVSGRLRLLGEIAKALAVGAGKGIEETVTAVGALGSHMGAAPGGYEYIKKAWDEKRRLDEAYERRFSKPTLEKSKNKAASKVAYEIGEWAAPTAAASVLGGPLTGLVSKGVSAAPAAARILANTAAKAAVEAPVATAIVNAGKPKEERTSIPESMAYWAGGELLGLALGKAGKAAVSRIAKLDNPTINQIKKTLSRITGKDYREFRDRMAELSKQQQLPAAEPKAALPPPKELAKLPPADIITAEGAVRPELAASGKELSERELAEKFGLGWPLNTQDKARLTFYKIVEDLRPAVKKRFDELIDAEHKERTETLKNLFSIPDPVVQKKALVDYVHEGLGGSVSKETINSYSIPKLKQVAVNLPSKVESTPVWDVLKEEAEKHFGVDLDDVYKTATDPEHARWKDIVGLGEYRGETPVSQPAKHTEGELAAAANILKNYKKMDIKRVKAVWDAYPELHEQMPEVGKWLTKTPTLAKGRSGVDSVLAKLGSAGAAGAEKILKSYDKTKPQVVKLVWDLFPELHEKYPGVGKWLNEKQVGYTTKTLNSIKNAWESNPVHKEKLPQIGKLLEENGIAQEPTPVKPELQVADTAVTQAADNAAAQQVADTTAAQIADTGAVDTGEAPVADAGTTPVKDQTAKKLKGINRLRYELAGLKRVKAAEYDKDAVPKSSAEKPKYKVRFRPITEITADKGSLTSKEMELLSNKPIIDGKDRNMTLREALKDIDDRAASLNQRIKHLKVQYNGLNNLPEEARAQYNKYVERLTDLDRRRENIRALIEEDISASSAKGAKSDIKPPENAKLAAPDEEIVLDRTGEAVVSMYGKSLSGREHPLDLVDEAVPKDTERMLKRDPTVVGKYLGVAEDVFGKEITTAAQNALRKQHVFLSHYEKKLYEIFKPLLKKKDKTVLTRVTLLLEGKDVPAATKTERQVAKELRAWYNELFEKEFFAGNPEKFLKDYAPRIRQYGSVLKAFKGMSVPEELKFFAELERKAGDIVFPMEDNALTAALAYLRLGARKKFLQPFIDETQHLRSVMSPIRKGMFDDYVKGLLFRPTDEEIIMNGMINNVLEKIYKDIPSAYRRRWTNQVANLMTHFGYMGALAGNFYTSIKNLTQAALGLFTISSSPIENIKYANLAIRALATKEGREALKYCTVYDMRQFLEGVEDAALKGRLAKALKTAEKAGLWSLEKTDQLNIAVSYLGKLLYEMDHGASFAKAVKLANDHAGLTQFRYGTAHSPALFRSPYGRVLGMLMSWPINYCRMLYKLGAEKQAAKILYSFLGVLGAGYVLEKATGLDMSSTNPVQNIASNPVAAYLTGSKSIPVSVIYDALNWTVKTGNMILTGDPTGVKEAQRAAIRSLSMMVPFSVAAQRVYRAVQTAINDGYIYGPDGELIDVANAVTLPDGSQLRPGGMARVIPEELRMAVGTTVESKMRRNVQKAIQKEKALRALAQERAYRIMTGQESGDLYAVQREIMEHGGAPYEADDALRRLMLQRYSTGTQRHAVGLTKGFTVDDEEVKRRELLHSLLGI